MDRLTCGHVCRIPDICIDDCYIAEVLNGGRPALEPIIVWCRYAARAFDRCILVERNVVEYAAHIAYTFTHLIGLGALATVVNKATDRAKERWKVFLVRKPPVCQVSVPMVRHLLTEGIGICITVKAVLAS